MITNKDVEKLKETFATKEDLKQFATKKELKNLKILKLMYLFSKAGYPQLKPKSENKCF